MSLPWRQLALLLAGLSLLGGCVNRDAQKQAKRTEAIVSDTTVAVTAEPASLGTVSQTLEITGAITTADDTTVGAKVGGRLVGVYVDDGDPVSAGQLIAQQETTDASLRVKQAQAGVDAARAQLEQALHDAQVGPTRSTAAVRASEARVAQQREFLKKVQAGDREEQRRQVQSAVNAARIASETAKKDLERMRRLLSEGAASQQDVDRAENAYSAALAQYERTLEDQRMQQTGARPEDVAMARQQLAAAEEQLRTDLANKKLDVQYQLRVEGARANLRSAQETLALAKQSIADAAIRSPFSGRVAGKPAKAGTFLGPGSPVARIVGAQGVYFEGQVPESQVRLMRTGTPVDVTIDALGSELLAGRIVAVSPYGSETGRVFRVRVSIEGKSDEIKPGMFARGKVELKRIPDALVVPSLAVITEGDEHYVYLSINGKAKKVRVTTGLTKNGLTQVDGIRQGDMVIVKGQERLIDGSAIKIEQPKSSRTDATESRG